jgi:hypothetical protein
MPQAGWRCGRRCCCACQVRVDVKASEDQMQTAQRTPPSPRGSLTSGGAFGLAPILFSTAVVLRSDLAYPIPSVHYPDERRQDDLPNEATECSRSRSAIAHGHLLGI